MKVYSTCQMTSRCRARGYHWAFFCVAKENDKRACSEDSQGGVAALRIESGIALGYNPLPSGKLT